MNIVYYVYEFCCFFFFKQKTAYEMRISDWSSDVCSSDLLERRHAASHCWDTRRTHRHGGQAGAGKWRQSRPRRRHRVCADRAALRPGRRHGDGRGEPRHRHLLQEPEVRAHLRAGHRLRHRRSEEHTSELQSLMRISYAVFCLKKKKKKKQKKTS